MARKQAEEDKARTALEADRQLAEDRERWKAAEAKRKAAEADADRQLAEDRERWKAAEAKRKAAEEAARRNAAAATGNGGNAGSGGPSARDLGSARSAWASAIKRKVKGNWRQPSERFGMSGTARLKVNAPGTIGRFSLNCNGSPAFCESLKAAIHGSDPFPKPQYDELYSDTLVITFE